MASKCSRSHARPRCWAGACLVLAVSLTPSMAFEPDPRYVFISSPTKKVIYYAPLPSYEEQSKHREDKPAPTAQILIDGNPTQVPTPAPAAAAAEEEETTTLTESNGLQCAASHKCAFELNGNDAGYVENTDYKYYKKDEAVTLEQCTQACNDDEACVGMEHDTDKGMYCMFWLQAKCDVTKGSDNTNWMTDAKYTTCSKQTTTLTTTVQATTTTAAECSWCLEQPEGLAMWHGKEKAVLYVADTAASKIYAYQITGTLDFDPLEPMKFGTVKAGPRQLVLKEVNQVSGLALDGFGNLFFSTMDGTIGTLAASALVPDIKEPVATLLYTSESEKGVQSPYSLAADNFNVYWGNQANGAQEGVVISAFERDAEALKQTYPDFPKKLATNAPKAMGVCVARSNVFYTIEATTLFGVKTAGGSVVPVYTGFKKPKGCAYDGDSTLYVADNSGDEDSGIYTLPANFPTIRGVKRVQQVAKVEEPGSVAIFTRAEKYQMQSEDHGFLGLGW